MPQRAFPLGRGLFRGAGVPTGVMGIINVTPDSFSDGGVVDSVDRAVALGRAMVAAGADVLDVGGESTRPDAVPVSVGEELRRVVPVVRALVERIGVPVSVDTVKGAVFEEAWAVGASMLNDVSGLADDPDLGAAAARTDAAVILMHRRGTPATMAARATYKDVVAEVEAELREAVARAHRAGIADDRLVLDPGLGFAKNAEHNLAIVAGLASFLTGPYPLIVGPSRKTFLGLITGRTVPADRDFATAVVVAALADAGVGMVRVHHVGAARDAIRMAAALRTGRVSS